MRVEPGRGNQRNPSVVNQLFANAGTLATHQRENGRVNVVGAADAFGDQRGRDGAQRSLFGRLPKCRIAANGRERAVPSPDGDGKIERGDDAYDAQRMPLFHHPVFRTLRGNRQSVKLPRKSNGEIADVDHFLDFTFAFGGYLSGFQRDQLAEVLLGVAQGVAELADDFAAFGCRNGLPFLKRRRSALNRKFVFVRAWLGALSRGLCRQWAKRFRWSRHRRSIRRKRRRDWRRLRPSFFSNAAVEEPDLDLTEDFGHERNYWFTLRQAASMMRMAVSMASSFTSSTGRRRMERSPQRTTSNPNSYAPFQKASRNAVLGKSNASNKPRPRTAVMTGCLRARVFAARDRNFLPAWRALINQLLLLNDPQIMG